MDRQTYDLELSSQKICHLPMVSECARVKGERDHGRKGWSTGLKEILGIFGIKISSDGRELTPIICSNVLCISNEVGRTTKGVSNTKQSQKVYVVRKGKVGSLGDSNRLMGRKLR